LTPHGICTNPSGEIVDVVVLMSPPGNAITGIVDVGTVVTKHYHHCVFVFENFMLVRLIGCDVLMVMLICRDISFRVEKLSMFLFR